MDRGSAGSQGRKPHAEYRRLHRDGTANLVGVARGAEVSLPNPLPRPPGELERLSAVWRPPRGIRILSAVNNTHIGLSYIGAALLFLILGGILALIMRAQLALPGNDLVDHDT